MTEPDEAMRFDSELTDCPVCGDYLRLTEPIESTGEGVAHGYLVCDGCDFQAREEWVHDETVETT